MPKPRIQLHVRARRRLTSHLDRLVAEQSRKLAAVVGLADAERLAVLRTEIRDYALALLRARLGLLAGGSSASSPARPAAASSGRPAPPSPASARSPDSAGPDDGAPRRNGRHYRVSPATLKQFCELTGVSASHIGGSGSSLAGIAFYFTMFAVLASETELPPATIRRLLAQLRETRAQIDAFILHWLNTSGTQWQKIPARERRRWVDALALSSPPPPS